MSCHIGLSNMWIELEFRTYVTYVMPRRIVKYVDRVKNSKHL